jgi:hypothetical protein
MLKPKPGLSKNDLINWAKESCGDGMLSLPFQCDGTNSDAMSYINDDDLKTIAYVPEANRCATRFEINQQAYKFENINNRDFFKTECDYTYTPFNIGDETLVSFLGEIPKPVVIPIHEINNIDEFDFNIFKPIIIRMKDYIDEGVSLSSLPNKLEDEYPLGAINCAEDILYEGTNQLTLDQYGSNYVKSITKIKSDLINGQQGLREGLAEQDTNKSINSLSLLIITAFTLLRVYYIKEDGGCYVKSDITISGFTGYLRSQDGFKLQDKLESNFKQVIFMQNVSGLIYYVISKLKREDIVSFQNAGLFLNLFRTYIYNLGFTTYDMVPITTNVRVLAQKINNLLGQELIIFDCEDSTNNSERCGRYVEVYQNGESYHIVITNVTNKAVLSEDNAMRLFAKYMKNTGTRNNAPSTRKGRRNRKTRKGRKGRRNRKSRRFILQ